MSRINAIIPVAGLSSRMGEFKPLIKIDGRSIIETVADKLIEAGIDTIVVVLGYRGEEVEKVLSADPVRRAHLFFAYNENYNNNQMLDSIKLGISLIKPCDCFFVVPGDMPAISVKTYKLLIKHFEASAKGILFPSIDGYKKHPPLLSHAYADIVMSYEGAGLRELWKVYSDDIELVPVDDMGCTMDADTKDELNKIIQYEESKKEELKKTKR